MFIKRTPYFLLICITWILSGCNETFEPWQENDQYHFSMFGYLDASADTQWVRIMPVREELFLEPRPLDFIVTMEHAESGESIVMQDSLFSYFQGYAWNFRSEMDIRPGQTYRITASHPDGRSSHTTVQLPEDFPTPILHTIPGGSSGGVEIYTRGIERIADVRTIYTFELPGAEGLHTRAFHHLKDTTRQASGEFVIRMDPREDTRALQAIGGPLFDGSMIADRRVFIASAGPGFHPFPFLDENVTALPGGISNIENGTGYVAGIVSKTIPYESCFDENFQFIACDLLPPPW